MLPGEMVNAMKDQSLLAYLPIPIDKMKEAPPKDLIPPSRDLLDALKEFHEMPSDLDKEGWQMGYLTDYINQTKQRFANAHKSYKHAKQIAERNRRVQSRSPSPNNSDYSSASSSPELNESAKRNQSASPETFPVVMPSLDAFPIDLPKLN